MTKELTMTNGDVRDVEERCPACNESVKNAYEYCPWCGVEL